MKKRNNFKRLTVIIISLNLLLYACILYAQQSDSDLIKSEVLQTEKQNIVQIQSDIASGPFEASLSIDTEPCKTWPPQCSNTGHSAYGASQANHNPIRINIQVLSKTGTPVTNLNFGNFNISCPLMPPSSIPLKKLECGDCFLSGGDGIYAFFVHPDPAHGNIFWRFGTHVCQVQVSTSKSKVVRVFAPFVIP